MASSVDPLYDLYKNKGFVPIEIITNGIVAMICCVGIGLNSSLVYVTIKTKSLHSPCMILIALYAFFASFLLFGNCVKFVIFVFGFNYITLRACFYIQIVPLIGTAIALTLQICIGLDRLIRVIFPIWSIINGLSAYIGSSSNWEKPVIPQFYRLPILCLHEDIKNLTEFLREGPPETVTTTTTTASAIISPITPSPPAAFPLLFWTTIICLLLAILLLQIITMAKSVRDHLAKRASSNGYSHHRRQRSHHGSVHGVELNSVRRPPFIQAFPAPLAVNSRPAAVGMCLELSFHQQLNRQWALAEHAAQPVQIEVVNDCVATKQLEDIQEEDDEEF
uniref:Uncharacterized protein n=1 Tax=Globodera rostochiensis TaxID=31243 RepID=A0A914HYW2_GLORO